MRWLPVLVSLALWQMAGAVGLNSSCCREINIGSEPYMASLHSIKDGHVCSATLVTTTWLLTAAQCIVDQKAQPRNHDHYVVLMGTSTVSGHRPIKEVQRGWPNLFVVHPMFSAKESIDYDLGMIRVQEPMVPNRLVDMVPLPKDVVTAQVLQASNCSVVGWARTGEPRGHKTSHWRLVRAELEVSDANTCANHRHKYVREHVHLCTLYNCPAVCFAGAGSALVCQGVQVGVVSFLVGNHGRSLGVHARVDTQLAWVLQVSSGAPPQPRGLALCAAAAALWLPAVRLLLAVTSLRVAGETPVTLLGHANARSS